ncbi:5'-3' exonuclease H3TH domain-containing protein [uncultured Jatrophihabitans sp.]|uniref:5'-3' exonuclease n=1 Tax=uncultured Jatrophihabitans sp. TaxID=1610747 RepID=UPI0035CC438C
MDADTDTPVVLAVDGNSLVHRSFHAQARTGAHADGRPAWAVRGLLMQLVAAVDRIRPAVVVIGFDDPDHSVRREQWPAYKAQRADKLDTLVDQLATAVATVHAMGLHVVVPAGLEADDVLASAAALAPTLGARTVVVTSDRDAFALIDEHTRVLRIINGGVDASPVMTADRLELLLGIRPEHYRDYAALRGDPSDNLPGVRGIGPRTAAAVLQHFGSAAAACADLAAVESALGAGVARRLRHADAHAAWAHNCEVMAMRHDVELGLDLASGPGRLPLDADAVRFACRRFGLTWTAKDALRVLADEHTDDVEPAAAPRSFAMPWQRTDPGWTPAPKRLPKLAPRRPQPAQLSLFD